MRRRFSFASIAAGLFTAGLITISVMGNTGCSIIYNASADQCSTNGDCQAKGLAASICSSDHVCIQGCASHDDCTRQNGGKAALCGSDFKCVKIENEGCTIPRDPNGGPLQSYKDPNAIFIGELTARTSRQIPSGNDIANQLVMADGEIRDVQAQGLPPAPGAAGGARRPLVPVACETADDPNLMTTYAKHLVNDVNAPIIVSSWNPHAIRVHGAVAASGKSVLELCSLCTADIRQVEAGTGDVNTIFQITAAGVDLAPGIAAAASYLETNRVRMDPSIKPTDQIRLALIVTTGLEGAAPEQTSAQVLKTLQFNGKSAADNGSNYHLFQYSASDDRAALAKAIAQFAPHIIVPITLAEANLSIFPLIESNWPAGAMRAQYAGSVGQQQASMLQLVQGNEDLRKRVIIVNLTPSTTNQDKFNAWKANYQIKFNAAAGLAPASYDAYYAAAYSVVAAGAPSKGTLAGSDLVRGLSRLKGGSSSFFVGTADLVGGMSTALGGSIDLSGLVLTMNFDPNTGRIPLSRIPFFCIGYDASNPLTFYATKQYFDASSGTLQGTFTCPGGPTN